MAMGGKHGRWRVWVLLALCALAFGVFAARLADLQFNRAAEFAQKAQAAATVRYTLPLPAARGSILDRDGEVLARDTTVYDLYLTWPAPPGTAIARTLETLAGLDLPGITGGKDVETQLAAFSASVSAGAMPLARGLSADAAAALYAAGLPQSRAVRLVARGTRGLDGLDGTLLPHALGFTGPVTAEQWAADDHALRAAGVTMDAELGRSGLEAAYDEWLRGTPGQLAVTARIGSGTLVGEEVTRAPAAGANLELYLDAGLQRVVQQALAGRIAELQATKATGKGRECGAGAAVVVDVRTGGILAAASWPGYDLAQYHACYAALAQDPAAPLLDRVLNGLYAPGSAFKPAVAASALAAGLIEPEDTVHCTGRYRYYSGYQPKCLQLGHSGPVDLYTALQRSCNIFFYDVGRRLGVDAFSATARQLGLAADTGVELPAAAGRLTWSEDENYQDGLVLMAAIGQGNTAVTPLQLASYAAALANDGARPALRFAARAYDAASGETLWQADRQTEAAAPGGAAVFGPIREGMVRMAGTLAALRGAPVTAAAKTGSPQRPETKPGGGHYTNSVLIAYAPAEAPRIAAAVVLEYGGGGSNAAPVLRAILDAHELWE